MRTGEEEEVLHARLRTLQEDRMTQSPLRGDPLPRRCPDTLEDEVLEESEHLGLAPLRPEDLRAAQLHLEELCGPQHRGQLVSHLDNHLHNPNLSS